jgi:GT2 family glycosyltransferase
LPSPLRASVVICAYNEDRWDLLCDAVASVGDQTFSAYEVIIVVDHNERLQRRARAAFPSVRVVRNQQLRGLSGARNAGVHHATGDVVVFLDDDARAEPSWLLRLLGPYRRREVIGTGGQVVPRWEAQPPRWLPPEFYWVVGCSYVGLPEEPREIRNPLGANMSFRREALDRIDGFTHGIGRIGKVPLGCEETELAIRVGRETGGSVVYLPSARVEHFVPSTRTTWHYFATRCWSEGLSKSYVAASVGRDEALSTERSYVTRTLPRGILRSAADVARGDSYGLPRALAIVAGVGITAAGYAAGLLGSAGAAALRDRRRTAAPPPERLDDLSRDRTQRLRHDEIRKAAENKDYERMNREHKRQDQAGDQ